MINLVSRSLMVLALLFGLFFAVGMGVLTYFGQPLWIALVLAGGVLLLQYLLGPWIVQLIFKIEWVNPHTIDPDLAAFIERVCADRGIRVPRFGIIHDGNPNAFTFGHYPGDARLVVTSGLLERLNEQEAQTVVAHELGHIVHWDFVVMTLAAVIPLALYVLYVSTRRRRGGNAGYAALISIASYVAYIISQFIVLLLSRVREYYADQFAGQVTGNPEALSTALVKIGYGLATASNPAETEEGKDKKKKKETNPRMMAARAFGIFDVKAASNMALASIEDTETGEPSLNAMTNAMQWDLQNPWGMFYELISTHPLPAKRIRALTRQAEHYHQPSRFIAFARTSPRNYWGVFLEDFIVSLMPWIGLLTGIALAGYMTATSNITGAISAIGAIILLFSTGWWLRRMYSYRPLSNARRNVRSLVGEIEVSGIRPIPCALEGQIIGRGVPGLFYSDDLVLQDHSGYIVMDYRQPLRIFEFLFGWFRAEKLIGKRGRAVGWYRRTLRPNFEMRRLELDDGTVITSYFYPVTQFFIYAGMALGALILGVGVLM
jgi:heat shock protein HtpX